MPPVVKKWSKVCLRQRKRVKILPRAVKNGQNMAPAVKYGLIILKNVADGALPEKMHQAPPDSKAALIAMVPKLALNMEPFQLLQATNLHVW